MRLQVKSSAALEQATMTERDFLVTAEACQQIGDSNDSDDGRDDLFCKQPEIYFQNLTVTAVRLIVKQAVKQMHVELITQLHWSKSKMCKRKTTNTDW